MAQLVGVLGTEAFVVVLLIDRVPDLNDVERDNIMFVPFVLIEVLFNGARRRFGGGDGGGNGTQETSALPLTMRFS